MPFRPGSSSTKSARRFLELKTKREAREEHALKSRARRARPDTEQARQLATIIGFWREQGLLSVEHVAALMSMITVHHQRIMDNLLALLHGIAPAPRPFEDATVKASPSKLPR